MRLIYHIFFSVSRKIFFCPLGGGNNSERAMIHWGRKSKMIRKEIGSKPRISPA